MDVGTDDFQWQDYRPELLCLGLRCPVCLDIYERPHTLGCGHTFCLRCLRTLAKMARNSTSRSPLDRLRFRCPACRKMTVARPLLRRHAAVTIALQDVVDAWLSSPYAVGTLESITLRSISSQTDDSTADIHRPDESTQLLDSITNSTHVNTVPVDTERTDVDDDVESDYELCSEKILSDSTDDRISREEIRHVTVHRFPIKSTTKQDLESDLLSIHKREETATETNDTLGSSDATFETSSSEEDSEPEVVHFFGDIHIIQDPPIRRFFGIRSFVTVLKLLVTEIRAIFSGIWNSRCRLGLTIFWFAYGGLIVSLSRGFLPWMVLYTLVYFFIMYAEMARPFMMRY